MPRHLALLILILTYPTGCETDDISNDKDACLNAGGTWLEVSNRCANAREAATLADPPPDPSENPHALNTLMPPGVGNDKDRLRVTSDETSGRDIQKVIKRGSDEIARCFRQSPAQISSDGGRFDLTIDIGPMGTVLGAAFDPEPLNERFETCIRNETRRWKFPPHDASPIKVTMPLVFGPPPKAQCDPPNP